MDTLTTILVLAAIALAALAVWKRAAIVRIFSGANRRSAENNPLAALRRAVDDGVTRIQQAKETLEQSRALIRSAQRQVESSQREKARLESRIAAALEQGDSQTAKSYAVQLADVERQLAEHQQHLAKHEEAYQGCASQVEAARQRVLEARRKASELGEELEQSQRERELAQFAADMASDAGQIPQAVARAEESVLGQVDQNRAVGRVAADLAGAGRDPASEETAAATQRDAAANEILQRFQKPRG